MAWAFISFWQLFTLATKQDRRLHKTGVYYFKFLIKDFWVINSNGSWWHLCRDPLDTVHHEIDSMVRGYHVYKSVWLPVIVEQLVLEKEPATANPHDEVAVTMIKDSLIAGGPHFVWKFIHRSHGILLHDEVLSSAVWHLLYYWEKEGRKGLEIPFK